ncbi:MAG: hypothetical protein EOP06_03270 [Proteobacteria bacterium]|nr:MAG: hypothetical protein EOP06_03270 [Pseudomonadota bacterium]
MEYLKSNIILLLVLLAIALSLKTYFELTFFLSFLIVFVGLPLVGYIVTIDDDFKGGRSNPDGTRRKDFLTREFWGQIAARSVVVFVGAGIDLGIVTSAAISAWLAGTSFTCMATYLLSNRNRPLCAGLGLIFVIAAVVFWNF